MRHTFRYLIDHQPRPGARTTLCPADSHHLTRVVRRRVGDSLELIDPAGVIWPATLIADGTEVLVQLATAPRTSARQAPVTLYQGVCEWGRLDLVVEKATELGIAKVVLFAGIRSQRVPDPAAWQRRRERLVRVAEAAARQSGRGRLPDIDGLLGPAELCDAIAATHAVVLDPSGDVACTRALADAAEWNELALVIGPDTGFTADELAGARAGGAAVCHFGDTILRAETAAIVAITLALAATGHLDRQSAVVSTHGGLTYE